MAEVMDTSAGGRQVAPASGSNQAASSKDSKVTGIWIVGDALPPSTTTNQGAESLLLGLPVHRIPDADAARIQNFGNVAFVLSEFDGPDFQLIQVRFRLFLLTYRVVF